MTGKERVQRAMQHKKADRVPLFCQLALGHYMVHTEYEPYKIWHSPQTFGDALLELAEEYSFDGILVNLPGRQRDWESHIAKIEKTEDHSTVHWDDGSYSICPENDNVHHFSNRELPSIDMVDPEQLFYIEPHDITGIKYPFYYGFDREERPFTADFFPDYVLDPHRYVVSKNRNRFHVSGEVFSPFSQLMELFGYTEALMALMDKPDKVTAILERLSRGAAEYAILQANVSVDAVLVSSAFAGGGFISREQYSEFVLPYERYLVDQFHRRTDIPIYVHTCGAIGDRIDLMIEAGYDGVDTMDPPPLGNTNIEVVKQQYGDKLFLKGNIDPVNLLLKGSPQEVYKQAVWLIHNAGEGGGYILSSACSVSPAVSPENIHQLYRASVDYPY
jgi:uroporphyrinogen-III decarboxylase